MEQLISKVWGLVHSAHGERRAGSGRSDTGSAYRLTEAPDMHRCAGAEVIASLLLVLKKPSRLIWGRGIQFFFYTAVPFGLMDLGRVIVNGLSFHPVLSLAQVLEHGFLQRSRTYSAACVWHVALLYGGFSSMETCDRAPFVISCSPMSCVLTTKTLHCKDYCIHTIYLII